MDFVVECASVKKLSITQALDRLELNYGQQSPYWPTEPYEFLVWWHCGYPQSDERCEKGWQSLTRDVGTSVEALLRATPAKLRAALAAGGMVPELRAERLKEIALRVQNEFGGDLRSALVGPTKDVRKLLKSFPNIADPGADRILLFGDLAEVAAVPSNCPHVLVRIVNGVEHENYGATYKEAQQMIAAEVAPTREARQRAYLLLKIHGQRTCKAKPRCEECTLQKGCAFAQGKMRGKSLRS
jgi:endonuclease III